MPVIHPTLNIPQSFFQLAKSAACFRDDQRWSLLYSVAWRLLFEDKQLLSVIIDPQVSRLLSMQKSVNRDRHKMEAFVRFKCVNQEQQQYIAWFEPEHLIVESKSRFFIERFYNMNWSILTPDLCMHWNQEKLSYTEGISKPTDIDDELETLWLEYYKNIFNPARLKVKAMQSEMPKKYWANLPEANLIQGLIRESAHKVQGMVDEQNMRSSTPNKIINASAVKAKQSALRQKRREDNTLTALHKKK